MPDPKLQQAMEEIKAILTKYDLAALISLGGETHHEHLTAVTPSWSCVKLFRDDQGRIGIRVKALRADFPSLEAQRECVTKTVGMFVTFHDIARKHQQNMENLLVSINKQIQFNGKSIDEPPPRFKI